MRNSPSIDFRSAIVGTKLTVEKAGVGVIVGTLFAQPEFGPVDLADDRVRLKEHRPEGRILHGRAFQQRGALSERKRALDFHNHLIDQINTRESPFRRTRPISFSKRRVHSGHGRSYGSPSGDFSSFQVAPRRLCRSADSMAVLKAA